MHLAWADLKVGPYVPRPRLGRPEGPPLRTGGPT